MIKKKREAAVAAIVRIFILCSGCTFGPSQNPQSHLNDALSPMNGSSLKEESFFKGHKIYDTGSTLESPCDFIKKKKRLYFTGLLEHEFYCQCKAFCNETSHYTG